MRYIIPYSFSQQNEFYKVYNTKEKKKRKEKKITVPQLFWLYSISTFAEVFTQI